MGIGELRIGEMGISKMGIGEIRVGEMGIGKMGSGELGIGEMGISEMGIGEIRIGELGKLITLANWESTIWELSKYHTNFEIGRLQIMSCM